MGAGGRYAATDPRIALRRWVKRGAAWVCWVVDDEVAVADLRAEPAQPRPAAPGGGCRPILAADVPVLRGRFGARRTDEFARRLSDSSGTMVDVGGVPAGYVWMTRQRRRGEGAWPFLYEVAPRTGILYIYDLFVARDRRGMGLATALVGHALDAARQEPGARQAFLTFDRRNPAMRALTARLGFRLTGRLTYRRAFGVERRDTSALRQVSEI